MLRRLRVHVLRQHPLMVHHLPLTHRHTQTRFLRRRLTLRSAHPLRRRFVLRASPRPLSGRFALCALLSPAEALLTFTRRLLALRIHTSLPGLANALSRVFAIFTPHQRRVLPPRRKIRVKVPLLRGFKLFLNIR